MTYGKDTCGEERHRMLVSASSYAPARIADRLFDTFLSDAAASGVRQAVFLASDLDPRPYQLPWPADMTVYVVDTPEILAVKTSALTGVTPSAAVRPVAAELGEDWPTALVDAGFDPDRPAVWSVEGALPFLPLPDQRQLVSAITALSTVGSRLISEVHSEVWVNPFDDADILDSHIRWRESATPAMIMHWHWRIAGGRYVTAHLSSERPTGEYEVLETVLDPGADPGSRRRCDVHRHAGTDLLRGRRRFGHRQRQGR
ncbi:hypothetical protein MMAGJ_20180 [Mycolicibacterium mageritense]|uniref:S-adenosyl-L-methionine-dependent methyltransferase n=2 Tax=Mycolicibacterium mageritense TaxID=53462 RepID=A0ABM7HQB7_MYCME|nr:hypothetical protein MMAGJ_20180 [Mycolicibacterium mageritense]